MIPISKPVMEKEEIEAVVKVMESGRIVRDGQADLFEEQFSGFIGTGQAVSCSSGTAALQIGLEALGLRGSEVITTPFTFIATANAIAYNGARPVFADVDERTFNIDPLEIEKKITDKTKAVMVVHLYGQPCEMKLIKDLCEDKDLKLIEDACQAHGAEYGCKKVGTFGDFGAFSFYATKNMTTGEGGMITTDSEDIARRCRMIINQGQSERYEHDIVGYNFRLTDLQAAIGIVQLSKLKAMNERRRLNAEFLSSKLRGLEWLETPHVMDGVRHAWHQYTVKVPEKRRDGFIKFLDSEGVGARVYYPKPVHLQPAYMKMGEKAGCPVAEAMSRQVVSLPVHPSLKRQDLIKIVETVEKYGEVI